MSLALGVELGIQIPGNRPYSVEDTRLKVSRLPLQRIDQCPQRWRYATDGIVEMQSGEGGAPVIKDLHKATRLYVGRCMFLEHISKPGSCKHGSYR